MLSSLQRRDAALSDQVAFWNQWNAEHRKVEDLQEVSIDQQAVVTGWLNDLNASDLDIIEVGCGTGWMCQRLTGFGQITGTDLSDTVLAQAQERVPSATFVPGDFMSLDFGGKTFDVAVTLEVLSHVTDQAAFIAKIASHLKPGGRLMLATQNRPQLERNDIPPPKPGQIRQWVDSNDLRGLLDNHFEVEQLFSITPTFNRGMLRYVNSRKVAALFRQVSLGVVPRALKRVQEQAGLGWTLMALARKR